MFHNVKTGNIQVEEQNNIIARYNQWQQKNINKQYLEIVTLSKNVLYPYDLQLLFSWQLTYLIVNFDYNNRHSISIYCTYPIIYNIMKTINPKFDFLGYMFGIEVGLYKYLSKHKTINFIDSIHLGIILELMFSLPIHYIQQKLFPFNIVLSIKLCISNNSIIHRRYIDLLVGFKVFNQLL